MSDRPTSPAPAHPRASAALAGILAAVVSLAFAELIAGILSVRSPVIAVGDVVVDNVPPFAKDFAIETFGTHDKLALLIGIGVLLTVFAVITGLVAWRSLGLGAAMLALFGVIGLAAGIGSPDPALRAALPAPIGVVLGFVTLRSLRNASIGSASNERRVFLKQAVIFTASAAILASAGRYISSRAGAAASRAAVMLPGAATPKPAIPAATSRGVNGIAPFVTPNADFYRIDTALTVPQVNTDGWTLRVRGMVDRELSFTYDELLQRTLNEYDITMTCVSNVVGGELVGNARWLGFPISELLEEAGVDPASATQIVGRSVDGYTCGFPTAALYDGRQAIIAVGMNGEPLPLEHGFPARMVTAGLYGYVSATKWLTELELTTMEGFDSYWVPRGYAKEAPIKTESRIDTPRGFDRVPAGKAVMGGVAWAQPRGISKVEVRIDSGPWIEATLGEALNNETWRQWSAEWDVTPGLHNLTVRATDNSGATQTEVRKDTLPDGATGWHSVSVTGVA